MYNLYKGPNKPTPVSTSPSPVPTAQAENATVVARSSFGTQQPEEDPTTPESALPWGVDANDEHLSHRHTSPKDPSSFEPPNPPHPLPCILPELENLHAEDIVLASQIYPHLYLGSVNAICMNDRAVEFLKRKNITSILTVADEGWTIPNMEYLERRLGRPISHFIIPAWDTEGYDLVQWFEKGNAFIEGSLTPYYQAVLEHTGIKTTWTTGLLRKKKVMAPVPMLPGVHEAVMHSRSPSPSNRDSPSMVRSSSDPPEFVGRRASSPYIYSPMDRAATPGFIADSNPRRDSIMETPTQDFPQIPDEIPHPLRVPEVMDPLPPNAAEAYLQRNPDIPTMPGVLVHCQLGCSRSATVVAAHLMHVGRTFPPKLRSVLNIPMHHDTGVSEVIRFLKTRRPNIRPNQGFQRQLLIWSGMGATRFDSENRDYKSFRAANKRVMDAVAQDQARIKAKIEAAQAAKAAQVTIVAPEPEHAVGSINLQLPQS